MICKQFDTMYIFGYEPVRVGSDSYHSTIFQSSLKSPIVCEVIDLVLNWVNRSRVVMLWRCFSSEVVSR